MRLPFWVAAALTLANAAYGWFVVPESLPPERRSGFSLARANPVGALALLRGRPALRGLVVVQALDSLAHFSLSSVFVLYASYRYGWDSNRVGLTLAFVGVCTALVQGLLIGPAVRALGERRALLVGLGCGTLAFAGYALAPSGGWFLVAVPFGAMMGLYGAASQALMTARVSLSEQGQLQGVGASLMGLTGLAGPLLFSSTFAIGIRAPGEGGIGLPGAPFLVAALLVFASLLIALRVARPVAPSG
jgi:DHA1 family tetracycline resistance protein-like MFS transporter